jgi:hypothetical protein
MVIPSTKLIVLNPVIITDQKIKTKDNSSLFACINLRACQKHSAIKLTAAVDNHGTRHAQRRSGFIKLCTVLFNILTQ